MPEISLLPSIAPAPVTPAAPAGAASQSANTDPDPSATPSFTHRLRAALRDAHSHNVRAHRAATTKSGAQHADDTAQVQPDQDNTRAHSDADARDAAPASQAEAQQAEAVTPLETTIPARALMPAMAPLPVPQAGVASPQSLAQSTSAGNAADGLALGANQRGQAQLAASVFASQALAPGNLAPVANGTLADNPVAQAAAPIAPAQPTAMDPQQLTAIPAVAAPATIPLAASDGLRSAAPVQSPAKAEGDGAPAQLAAAVSGAAPAGELASAAFASGVLTGAPVQAAGPTSVSSAAADAPGPKLRGLERNAPTRGAQTATSAPEPRQATSAQVVGEAPAGLDPRTGSDEQHSPTDSGLAAANSDAQISSAPVASSSAAFASHLTNAQAATLPVAGSADQSARATEVATQIARQADLYRLPGGKGVRIQLHPDDLGGVDVTLRYSPAGGVQLHINVEHAATGQLVQAGWAELRDALAAQGITPDRLMMSVTAPSGGSGLDMSFNGQNGGRAGADLAGFSQGHAGQRQSSSRDDDSGLTRTWFSDMDAPESAPADRARSAVATSSRIDYRV